MGRGVNKDTPGRIQAARESDPRALGPLLGLLCTDYNLTAAMVAEFIGSHEQTVLRWFFGDGPVTPRWMPSVVKLICVLDYMRTINAKPLTGNVREKSEAFGKHVAACRKLMTIGP